MSESTTQKTDNGGAASIAALMAALLVAIFAFQLNASMLSPALVTMQNELNTTADAIGLTQTVFFTAAALFSLFLPRLADLKGRKKVLSGMLALTGIGCLISAIAPNVTVLMIGRIFQGVAGPVVPMCLIILHQRVTEEKRYTRLMSILTSVNGGIAGGVDRVGGIDTTYAAQISRLALKTPQAGECDNLGGVAAHDGGLAGLERDEHPRTQGAEPDADGVEHERLTELLHVLRDRRDAELMGRQQRAGVHVERARHLGKADRLVLEVDHRRRPADGDLRVGDQVHRHRVRDRPRERRRRLRLLDRTCHGLLELVFVHEIPPQKRGAAQLLERRLSSAYGTLPTPVLTDRFQGLGTCALSTPVRAHRASVPPLLV